MRPLNQHLHASILVRSPCPCFWPACPCLSLLSACYLLYFSECLSNQVFLLPLIFFFLHLHPTSAELSFSLSLRRDGVSVCLPESLSLSLSVSASISPCLCTHRGSEAANRIHLGQCKQKGLIKGHRASQKKQNLG